MKVPIDNRSRTPRFRGLFRIILYYLTSLIKTINDDKFNKKKLVHHSKIIKICYLFT